MLNQQRFETPACADDTMKRAQIWLYMSVSAQCEVPMWRQLSPEHSVQPRLSIERV